MSITKENNAGKTDVIGNAASGDGSVKKKEFSEKILDVGKDILRSAGLYNPSPEAVGKRSTWMAEIVVLKSLTEYKETGQWDKTHFIGDYSDRERRNLYLTLESALENPARAVSNIGMKIGSNESSYAAFWEKNGYAPEPSKKLEEFANLMTEKLGDTHAPGVLSKEIDRTIGQINGQKISEKVTSGSLFQTLSKPIDADFRAPSP